MNEINLSALLYFSCQMVSPGCVKISLINEYDYSIENLIKSCPIMISYNLGDWENKLDYWVVYDLHLCCILECSDHYGKLINEIADGIKVLPSDEVFNKHKNRARFNITTQALLNALMGRLIFSRDLNKKNEDYYILCEHQNYRPYILTFVLPDNRFIDFHICSNVVISASDIELKYLDLIKKEAIDNTKILTEVT